MDRGEKAHEAVWASIDASEQPLVTSQVVLAEVDDLLLVRGGVDVESALVADVASGADLAVGLADASMVVLAARYGTSTIMTLDERCFRAMRPLGGGHFTLLPVDR